MKITLFIFPTVLFIPTLKQNLQAQNQEVFNVKYVTNQNSTQEGKNKNTLRQNYGI